MKKCRFAKYPFWTVYYMPKEGGGGDCEGNRNPIHTDQYMLLTIITHWNTSFKGSALLGQDGSNKQRILGQRTHIYFRGALKVVPTLD